MNSYPKTREEWWLFVENHKENLLSLIKDYHPCSQDPSPEDLPITAIGAQIVCDLFKEKISQTKKDPVKLFEVYLQTKDNNLHGLLEETWIGIPESIEAHDLPGFGVLCDLCSESYLLYEEPETLEMTLPEQK